MDTTRVEGSYNSHRLVALTQHLRVHHQPLCSINNRLCLDGSGSSGCSKAKKSRRAAVLICIFEGENGDLRVFLTKRASTLSSSPGEVSLPGGKVDEGDKDDVQTALREAKEEIGLNPSLVDVVAVLEPITTRIGMVVVPVIGLLLDKTAFHPALNPDEVDEIFDAPLEMFLENEHRREQEREWNNEKYLLHYFDYEASNGNSFLIFALTAGILIDAASMVFQRSPAFIVRKPSFWSITK